jgi:hypothetical protein
MGISSPIRSSSTSLSVAVALVDQTDFLIDRAEVRRDLAEVLHLVSDEGHHDRRPTIDGGRRLE